MRLRLKDICMNIEEQVLAKLKPSTKDEARIQEIIGLLVKKVMGAKAAAGANIEPYLVGSIAKDTHLKDPDADLFLLFSPEVPRDTLEKTGLAIGKESITGREHYAEHPYIKGEFMGLRVDIVPAYKIVDSSQKMTAVDRTPFHTEYVKKHLAPEHRDDVRLLKAFMKGIGTYGADAKTMGFSGYLCELLVIRFRGFKKVIVNASGWKHGMRLELGEKTERKFDSAMTFIDPVDPARNVASAVSADNFGIFIAASRAYLASPKLEFYFPNPVEQLKHKAIMNKLAPRGKILLLKMPRPDIIDDILYPQLRKFEKNVVIYIESANFTVMDSASMALEDCMAIILEMETDELPPTVLHRGPPVWVAENSEKFLSKWRESAESLSAPFVKDGCWHVFVKRKQTSAMAHLATGLPEIDAGKDLNSLKDEVTITDKIGNDAVSRTVFSTYLDRRMPWER
jgi:tRNA nucleotidyltransferase (CCA-adding enzyme)